MNQYTFTRSDFGLKKKKKKLFQPLGKRFTKSTDQGSSAAPPCVICRVAVSSCRDIPWVIGVGELVAPTQAMASDLFYPAHGLALLQGSLQLVH